MDTDMKLDDALDATSNKVERDSLESIVITKHTETNFSLSGVKVGIASKRHPMPYDPANFSFTYSHDHSYTSGETTIYEK
jgi:cell surface protein SprA